MPGPPPPSASYLWKFDDIDTDSSSDDSPVVSAPPTYSHHHGVSTKEQLIQKQFYYEENRIRSDGDDEGKATLIEETAPRIPEPPEIIIPKDHVDEVDDDEEDEEDDEKGGGFPVAAKKSKRKRKNKKKRKKKQASATVAAVHASTAKVKKTVRFYVVQVVEFPRALGQGVPLDGGWPLGMDMNHLSKVRVSVDDYDIAKQARLEARWKDLLEADKKNELAGTKPLWQTRPFDYKRGVKNPLFRHLSERSRMKLLLTSTDAYVPSSPPSTNNNNKRGSRTRSKSITSNIDEYSDDFPYTDVVHARKEIEEIRASRSMEGHTGCTCRPLHVYLLPPGGGGRKAHSRRMSAVRVKEELRKRHALPAGKASRDELELLLHNLVAKEPCCAQDCECSQNGIRCQADTCSCWKNAHNKEASLVERCGNKVGPIYSVSFDQIGQYRKQVLQCFPIRESQ